ncbi:MAG: hypothetical protein RDV41_09685, partial [Planctomycetota bacterium]|nr:hypothetical protein [Planctomycetota bacterium]
NALRRHYELEQHVAAFVNGAGQAIFRSFLRIPDTTVVRHEEATDFLAQRSRSQIKRKARKERKAKRTWTYN